MLLGLAEESQLKQPIEVEAVEVVAVGDASGDVQHPASLLGREAQQMRKSYSEFS